MTPKDRNVGRLWKPSATPTYRGSLTSRMAAKARTTTLEPRPIRKQTSGMKPGAIGVPGTTSATHVRTFRPLIVIRGTRRRSSRSESQPISGAPTSRPTAASATRLAARTRGRSYTWVRYGTPQSPTKAAKPP